jgi:hypothetical protein
MMPQPTAKEAQGGEDQLGVSNHPMAEPNGG